MFTPRFSLCQWPTMLGALVIAGGGSLMAQSPGVKSILDSTHADISTSSGWAGARTSETFPRPVINDHGVIAFSVRVLGGGSANGDWEQATMQAGVPNVFTPFNHTTDGWPLWNQWNAAINNAGQYLWIHGPDMEIDGRDTFFAISTPSAPNTPVFYSDTSTFDLGFRSFGLTNTGLISYRSGQQGVHIYHIATGETTNLTLPEGETNARTGGGNLNDQGQLVFGSISGRLFYYQVGDAPDAVQELLPSNGVHGGVGVWNWSSQPALNNAGQVAFVGQNAADESGLYLLDLANPNGPAQLLDAMSGTTDFSISINDLGQIVYADRSAAGVDQLRFWTGSEALVLLTVGDDFEGSTLTSFDLSSYALNNEGEVVFGYGLANGVRGIGYFDYASIPEPSTVMIFASGALLLGGAAWRRRR